MLALLLLLVLLDLFSRISGSCIAIVLDVRAACMDPALFIYLFIYSSIVVYNILHSYINLLSYKN